MSTIWKNRFFIASLIFIPFVLVFLWFRSGLVIGGGDEALHFYDPKRSFELLSSIWIESGSGFPMLFWLSRAPFLYGIYLLHTLFYIPAFILQAGMFFLLMVTGVISTFYLTLHFLPKQYLRQIIAFVSAFFYLFNPYSMSQVWGRGQYAQYFTFALLPLVFLLFVIAIKKRKYIFAPIIALITFPFATAYGFITVVVIQWFLFLFLSIFILLTEKNKRESAIFLSIFFFMTFIIWVVFHAWWILPVAMSGNAMLGSYLNSIQENVGSLIGVSRNFTPLVLIRLLQDTYFFAPSSYSPFYSIFRYQFVSFIPPFFLLMGLLIVFKSKELRGYRVFGWLFLFGLIICLGANPPFGSLFISVFQTIPVLQMFRNPYEKFGLVFMLAYAPLFALGFVYALEYVYKKHFVNKAQVFFVGALLLFILNMYLWPMWSGKIVAFPDDKLGLPQMQYYVALESLLDREEKNNFRILMTPLWSGDGAFYLWREKRYQGVDPMPFFMNHEIISSTLQIPHYYDLMRIIRQKIYQEDLSGIFSLLRVQYLVDRDDAVFRTPMEEKHAFFLTDRIYPPDTVDGLSKVICQNQSSTAVGENPAWITCTLSEEMRNLDGIRYLHVIAKADVPANLDIAIKDQNENRPNWYGKVPGEYALRANEWTTVVVPLGIQTEPNNATDFTKIVAVDVRAHPFYRHNESVGKIEIKGIWLDPGTERKVNNFSYIKQFDKLYVYGVNDKTIPPEIGLLDSVEKVDSFDDLIKNSQKAKKILDRYGFILITQNQGKNLKKLEGEYSLKISESKIISRERYWMRLENTGKGLVILSKSYNPEWKVIEGVEERELRGGIFDDVALLKKIYLSEENHFVVNGYANLWKVNTGSDKIAVVFLPQVIADVGKKISIVGFVLIILVLFIYIMKKRIYGKE